MSYQTSSKQSLPFWLLIGARKTQVFWHQSEARTATVWNWSGKTLSPGALLAVLYFSLFHIYFSARLDFPSSPLSAPGSPSMDVVGIKPWTYKGGGGGGGGGGCLPPPSEVFLRFFVDEISAAVDFSSCSFILCMHFGTSLVMVSYHGCDVVKPFFS